MFNLLYILCYETTKLVVIIYWVMWQLYQLGETTWLLFSKWFTVHYYKLYKCMYLETTFSACLINVFCNYSVNSVSTAYRSLISYLQNNSWKLETIYTEFENSVCKCYCKLSLKQLSLSRQLESRINKLYTYNLHFLSVFYLQFIFNDTSEGRYLIFVCSRLRSRRRGVQL